MQEQEDKWLLSHLEDLAAMASQTGYAAFSDFLDERQRSLLSERRLPVCLMFFGGYPQAEKQIAVFYADYLQESIEDLAAQELTLLKITPEDLRFVKRKPEHRDYLGALMGTGLRRDKMGDVIVDGEATFVWVKHDMAAYIRQELTSVGAARVTVSESLVTELPKPQPGVQSVVSVSSMRIDAVISRGFNMGRAEAVKWIAAGKAFCNGRQMMNGSKSVAVGDKITLRGKGFIKIQENKGLSRSGRIQLQIERTGKQ